MNENNGAAKGFAAIIVVAICLILWVKIVEGIQKDDAQKPTGDEYVQITLSPEDIALQEGVTPEATIAPEGSLFPEATITPEPTAVPTATATPEPTEAAPEISMPTLTGTPAEVTDAAFRAAAEYIGAMEYDGRWQKILCMGDSLTAGVQGGEGVSYENPWPTVMRIFLEVSVENAGIGGSTIWRGGGEAMSYRITLCGEADAIFIMGGVNDWLMGAECPFGSVEEEGTFAYDANEMFAYVAENYPDADVFVILPLEPNREPEVMGATLDEYRELERSLAQQYGFYVMDFASLGILNAKDPDVRAAYYSDDIHLNTMGYQVLGTLITVEALRMTE